MDLIRNDVKKIKMAAIVGGLCTESLWRGYSVLLIGMKKFEDISGEAYVYNHPMLIDVFCSPFKIFDWFINIINHNLILCMLYNDLLSASIVKHFHNF